MIAQDEAISNYPILYSFRRCPYAMRARLALVVSGMVCELREVVLRDKPQEMLDVSPKGTVPVLVDRDGRVFDESIDIMFWALEQHDREQWLTPEQGSVEQMLELIDKCDRGFKYDLDRYKYPNRYENTDAIVHRTEGYLYLELLNSRLRETRYLFGNRVALADRAIAPFVRQFAHTDLGWFNQQQLPHLQAWLSDFLHSEIYNQIMQKYPKWESGNECVVFP
ncbi:glutathione S-transferase [Microcoleus sp. CAWBG640]|uniref:glutathione S-transferase n=1 Tax=Microcoleus sp. CAWBG640 TaxID=2841653 RepID=UPI00312B8C78